MSKALAKRIIEEIDEYCVNAYDDGHRSHLGASLIGRECKRYLWYVFRWCLREKTTGRQQRLFNRGHREELRFIEWLEGIGCKVWFEDREAKPDKNGEYPQYRIVDVMGHFGGSLDGVAVLPERYGISEPVLLEFKTNGTGAGFDKLVKDGMAIAKPEHFAQISTYGKKRNFKHCLYLNINKNDDSLYVEIVKLNHALGDQMITKAEQIILSQVAPARLSDNPTFYKCGYCHMREICHKGAVAEVNCRSCKFSKPAENARWFCEVHNGNIPKEYIAKACPSYKSITQNA